MLAAHRLCRKQYSKVISYSCRFFCFWPPWWFPRASRSRWRWRVKGMGRGPGHLATREMPPVAGGAHQPPSPTRTARRGSTPIRRFTDAFADWRSASFSQTRDDHWCRRWLECSLLKDVWTAWDAACSVTDGMDGWRRVSPNLWPNTRLSSLARALVVLHRLVPLCGAIEGAILHFVQSCSIDWYV